MPQEPHCGCVAPPGLSGVSSRSPWLTPWAYLWPPSGLKQTRSKRFRLMTITQCLLLGNPERCDSMLKLVPLGAAKRQAQLHSVERSRVTASHRFGLAGVIAPGAAGACGECNTNNTFTSLRVPSARLKLFCCGRNSFEPRRYEFIAPRAFNPCD